ncbi:MAG: hypothetical protein M3Q29_08465 [Chloroflexota bacterium]|nr:hypothetical protein [Chloroflexota bacterium]
MGFLDRLFGRGDEDEERRRREYEYESRYGQQQHYGGMPRRSTTDEQAVERYRYMLRTAPPDAIEQAHQEAFARLTPEQRRMVLQDLSQNLPPHERPRDDDPRSLARSVTRAEMRQPGFMERTFGGYGGGYGMGGYGMGGGIGMGGLLAGSFFSTLAASFIGTAIAQEFFDNDTGFDEGYAEGYQDAAAAEGDYGDQADAGGADQFSSDAGGDFGGGDFGDGGDFGGGEF